MTERLKHSTQLLPSLCVFLGCPGELSACRWRRLFGSRRHPGAHQRPAAVGLLLVWESLWRRLSERLRLLLHGFTPPLSLLPQPRSLGGAASRWGWGELWKGSGRRWGTRDRNSTNSEQVKDFSMGETQHEHLVLRVFLCMSSRGSQWLHPNQKDLPTCPGVENLSASDFKLLQKLALLKLTGLMEKHSPCSKQGWSW